MSRLSDYSKFDHLDENSNSDDDDDEQPGSANEEQEEVMAAETAAPSSSSVDQRQQETPQPSNAAQIPRVDDDARPAVNDVSSSSGGIHKRLDDDDSNQHRFVYMIHNQALYEWEQKVESVNIFVAAPPNAKASDILCNIQPTHLQLGMRHAIQQQQAYYFNFDLHGKIETNESTWYMDNNTICIVLTKAHPGQVWTRVFTTEPPMNSLLQQQVQQELMKERFQMEHGAGFDFRNAEFSGMAPNPREFMGGMPSI